NAPRTSAPPSNGAKRQAEGPPSPSGSTSRLAPTAGQVPDDVGADAPDPWHEHASAKVAVPVPSWHGPTTINPPGDPMIRVVAIEDDARYRASLEMLLSHSDDFELIRAFESTDAALATLESVAASGEASGWDLVLMDLDVPSLGGIECTRRVKERLPLTTIVVLTVFEDRGAVLDAICAGADGYLLKHPPADRLLDQLRTVVAGGSPLSAGIARTVLDLVRHLESTSRSRDAGTRIDLSPRELDVLRCLV